MISYKRITTDVIEVALKRRSGSPAPLQLGVIGLHYKEQIDQDIGRNSGLRLVDAQTMTVVRTSRSPWFRVPVNPRSDGGHSRLHEADPKPRTNPMVARSTGPDSHNVDLRSIVSIDSAPHARMLLPSTRASPNKLC